MEAVPIFHEKGLSGCEGLGKGDGRDEVKQITRRKTEAMPNSHGKQSFPGENS